MPTKITAGVGPGAESTDLVVGLGPHHPSAHGTLRLRLTLDDDRILSADPLVGYLHRGAEKLFEVRDYRQITVLANRHDWWSALGNELGVVLGVEAMLGIEVPPRAVWARSLLAELTRAVHHLAFLGAYPVGVGAPERARRAHAARERLQAVLEELTGGRMHHMINRVGGLHDDLPAGWLDRVATATQEVRGTLPALSASLLEDDEVVSRARGVGVLSPDLVRAYGVSGPAARASGVDLDLRRDDPYLAYGELFDEGGPGRVVVRPAGDCLARLEVMLEQCTVSLDLVDACVDRLRDLPPGPVDQRLPKVLKVPEGDRYTATEGPAGTTGYYLVSRGEKTPWRLKLRSASFGNVSVLGELLPGCRVGDLVPVLASLAVVVGDVDR